MKLNQLTIKQAIKGLKQKQFSSQELTQACLDQIKKTNKQLNSFITLNQQALKDAKSADKKIKDSVNSFKDQLLLGIPYAIKDNFLTSGLKTTAASKVLENYIPQYDATVYARLKSAGAILLGKTNMDAWAHGSSTETSYYKTAKNPWNLNHTPGGSSGGSAAAVASHQCIFAIGTETAGSIRIPACWCGVTGLKPTYGRVSRYGVIAMASSTDSPGPITKDAYDASLVLKVIAGHDPYDATSLARPLNLDLTENNYLKGLKIALPKEYFVKEMEPTTAKLVNQAIDKLKSLGAEVKTTSLLDPHHSISVYTIVQRSEVFSNLSRYDGIRFGNSRQTFGYEAKNRIMLGNYTLSSAYFDQNYPKAQKVRQLILDEFNKTFKKFDLVVGPMVPGPALEVGASQKSPMFGELVDLLAEPSSVAGLTGITIPCGFSKNLPVGLQITGSQFNENKVLQAAYSYQKNTDWHLKKPKL